MNRASFDFPQYENYRRDVLLVECGMQLMNVPVFDSYYRQQVSEYYQTRDTVYLLASHSEARVVSPRRIISLYR